MIIDFHTHIFPEKIAASTVLALEKNGMVPSHANGTEAGLLSAMESGGVNISVNLPVLTKPGQFESVFRFASEINQREYPENRKIISFAGIHPAMADIEEKMRLVYEDGFLGVKIHPDYQGEYIDSDGYARILSAAKKYGLVVVTHAGLDAAYLDQPPKCTPDGVLRLLDKVSGYEKFVLAHFGANMLFDEVYEKLAGENVYFDTAFILPIIDKELFLKTVDKHGAERILFATDSPWRNVSKEVEKIKNMGLCADSLDKILYKNGAKLLGLCGV